MAHLEYNYCGVDAQGEVQVLLSSQEYDDVTLTIQPLSIPVSGWPSFRRVMWSDGSLVSGDTVLELKTAKNAEINAARLSANQSVFAHEGKQFACDALSRSDIDGVNGIVAISAALPAGWPGGWKAVDNTYLPITTVAEWQAFYSAMVTQGTANFNRAQALKNALALCNTAEEISQIVW